MSKVDHTDTTYIVLAKQVKH